MTPHGRERERERATCLIHLDDCELIRTLAPPRFHFAHRPRIGIFLFPLVRFSLPIAKRGASPQGNGSPNGSALASWGAFSGDRTRSGDITDRAWREEPRRLEGGDTAPGKHRVPGFRSKSRMSTPAPKQARWKSMISRCECVWPCTRCGKQRDTARLTDRPPTPSTLRPSESPNPKALLAGSAGRRGAVSPSNDDQGLAAVDQGPGR